MAMLGVAGMLAAGAPAVLSTWDLAEVFQSARAASFEEYEFNVARGLEDGAEERETPGDLHGSVAVSG